MGTPSGEQKKWESKKAKIVGIAVAIITAATPGAYATWEAAKQAYKQRVEQRTRDHQESDLQKNLDATKAQLSALSQSCVTHRDLVDLVVKLRQTSHTRPVRHHTRPSRPTASETDLQKQLDELRAKVKVASKAQQKADVVKSKAPPLRPANIVRQQFEKKMK